MAGDGEVLLKGVGAFKRYPRIHSESLMFSRRFLALSVGSGEGGLAVARLFK